MTKPAILLDLKWENLKSDVVFRKALPDFEFINWGSAEDRKRGLGEVVYAVVWGPEPGLLARCGNLKAIFSVGAGVDHLFSDSELPDLPIVRFVDRSLTGPMVEWVVLQVLMHLRHQRQYDAMQRARQWQQLPQHDPRDLTIGIMGFGELGQASAAVLKQFGFPIHSWSQSPKNVEGVVSFHGNAQLNAFLADVDILISLLPLTAETIGIINAELIDGLSRKGPFGAPVLINAGRGGSQVEADILKALQDGRLHGASLDVFETEPLPTDSPLWGQENLFITPHSAALSDGDALAAHVAQQIARHQKGEDLQYLVKRQQGY